MLTEYSNKLYDVLKHINIEKFNSVFDLVKQADSVFVIGNGGSQSVAEHFCVDLIKFGNKKAYSISNTALLTMVANDYGYDKSFSWIINKYRQKDSLLFAMSTSGNSSNVVQSIIDDTNKSIFLTGLGGTAFREEAVCNLMVPSILPQIIEDAFSVICHTITIMLKNGKAKI